MAVGREDETDVEPPALRVTLRLIETVASRQAFLLGLNKRQGDWLGIDVDLDPENVVDLSPRPPPGFAVDDLDHTRRLFAPNKVFGPATLVNGWIDEFRSGVCLVVVHAHISSEATTWRRLRSR